MGTHAEAGAGAKQAVTLKPELLQYGGQAVIEGVMMRSPRYFAVACRKPDGTIVVQREEVDKTIMGKLKWLNWPFARGTLALIDAMALGTRALRYSSHVQLEAAQEEEENNRSSRPSPPISGNAPGGAPPLSKAGETGERVGEESPKSKIQNSAARIKADLTADAASIVNGAPVATGDAMPKSGRMNDIAVGGTLIFSLVMALLLFKLAPTALTDGLQRLGWLGRANNHTSNAVDGLIRMGIFFGYILLISQMQQIKRVFMYHGAEHKAINTLEAGLPLTRDNALSASRIHPRCGTSFIFIVLLIDLIALALLPFRPANILVRFLLQVAITPIVAGISYEVIKFAGKFRRNPLVMAAFAPGMATQYLTTREPDAEQTEVALTALYSVLEAEGHLTPQSGLAGDAPGALNPDEPAAVTA